MKAYAHEDPGLPGLISRPSAFIPIAMSALALSLVVFHIARYGTAREADEGTVAHLWQLLMGLQLPVIGVFAMRALRQSPRGALVVLAMQAVAGLAAVAPVWYFRW